MLSTAMNTMALRPKTSTDGRNNTALSVNDTYPPLRAATAVGLGPAPVVVKGFARWIATFQKGLSGAMYFMNKGSHSRVNVGWVYILFVFSYFQLLAFPLSPVFWGDSTLLASFSSFLSIISLRIETLSYFLPNTVAVWGFFFAGLCWITFILALATYAGVSSARARWYVQ